MEIYSLDELLFHIADAHTPLEYIPFWGPNVYNDGIIDERCLCQWEASPFSVDNITYPTAEHWMMAEKAREFSDYEMLERILAAPDPATAKKLGRRVAGFSTSRWDDISFDVVYHGNVWKFEQNPKLREYLLGTGDAVLVEASPYDTIWGIGLTEDDPGVCDPTKWQGQNRLGFVLMKVRQYFRA